MEKTRIPRPDLSIVTPALSRTALTFRPGAVVCPRRYIMEVVALLDKPSLKSFGMVSIIVRSEGRVLHVLDGSLHAQPISEESVAVLCCSGHAYDVSGLGASVDGPPRPLVAGWLGSEFLASVREVGAPVPEVPDAHFALKPHGSFWVGEPEVVFRTLKSWTVAAARRVFVERNAVLADLMEWVLPDEDETVAAVWWTRDSEEDRMRYLRLVKRVLHGRGRELDVEMYKSVLGSIVQTYVARPNSEG